MAVKCNLFLYAPKQLNQDFANICNWFGDNKLTIHFGDDKIKTILFASKRNIQIKQHSRVTYLGCIPDEIMSWEPRLIK